MKRDKVVVIQETKNPSSLSNLQPMTTTKLQKQRKIINHQGGVKKKVPELSLYKKEIIYPLLKEIISMEEINLLKKDNNFPGTKDFFYGYCFYHSNFGHKVVNCLLRFRHDQSRHPRNKYLPQ
jgi:hypothetical protein